MDNAAIHSQGNATVVKDMLWKTILDAILDGRPLHIHVISLSTCSPELNPIKLVVFHILAFWIHSF
jgi:hypothetical protein